jgi:hypothetical protein
MKKRVMPKGFRQGSYGPRIAVLFTEDLFNQIAAMATVEDKSFSAMVCELCRVGILDLQESDAHEPKVA